MEFVICGMRIAYNTSAMAEVDGGRNRYINREGSDSNEKEANVNLLKDFFLSICRAGNTEEDKKLKKKLSFKFFLSKEP